MLYATNTQQKLHTLPYNIGIVGYGNMGRAIAAILHPTISPKHKIYVLTKNEVTDDCVTPVPSYAALCQKADLIFLCIKPQNFHRDTIFCATPASPIIISIMAGVRIAEIQEKIGHKKIIRTMPNLPLHIGQGVVGYYANDDALSMAEQRMAMHVLQHCGTCIPVHKESMLDAITAVSGSGPAYVYLFMDALIQAAQSLGFDAEQARALVTQTIAGSVAYAATQKDTEIADLIARITSKKGTTEAALQTIPRKNFYSLWQHAIHAAHDRAIKLSTYDSTKS